ncbi:MAG: 3-deoxy-7-phosphoheptulonate synthase [Gaiellales bacterium]|jgi:3-deoxy-7-phosphoheptulonate synthase|nr:3-deoxy-7-phosphoheptulonate synthase [Gaiellales bacterium]
MAVTETPWTPASWRDLGALQQPEWPDAGRAESARAHLRSMPPLVFAGEARALQESLAEVAAGRAFLLQAGDCAESFHDTSAVTIREKLRILLQMSVVLTYAAALPVVKVGRIAGQFAKPRSAATERVGDVDLTSFYGHLVNDDAPTSEARVPDPQRMIRAYDQSARTLNLLRAFAKGGFADITRVHEWNQEFVRSSGEGRRYEQVANEIERALRFMTACGIDLAREAQLHQVDVWTSHEGLVLDYEEGLTRRDSLTGDWYDCSAHMLWLGERTRQADGGHAAFFAGVHNPIGVKLGPSATRQEVVELCRVLDPLRTPGRLTLIARMGATQVRAALPPLLRAVREAGHPVVWSCDPMHANGIRTASGLKTRRFDVIMDELEGFVTTCRAEDTWPGGVHLEFTGENVTECLGGAEAVLEDQLETRYMTLCDPRLNARQSLDLAFHLAELMRGDARPA